MSSWKVLTKPLDVYLHLKPDKIQSEGREENHEAKTTTAVQVVIHRLYIRANLPNAFKVCSPASLEALAYKYRYRNAALFLANLGLNLRESR